MHSFAWYLKKERITMKRFSRWLIFVLVGFILGNACNIVSATGVDYANLINLAGMQRMSTQKMSKEILLIAWNIDVDKNAEELKKTADTFERTLNGLVNGDKELGLSPSKERDVVNQLNHIQSYWNDFKSIVVETAASRQTSQSIMRRVSDLDLLLLRACDELVTMHEVEAEQQTEGEALIINLSARQRMLTQKMAKEFLLITLNVNAAENKLRLKHSAYLFERTLNGILKGDRYLKLHPTTNKAIIQQLSKVQSLWNDFKKPIDATVDTGKWSQDSIRTIVDLNLPLLTEMHKAVKMYENEYHSSLAGERSVWMTY